MKKAACQGGLSVWRTLQRHHHMEFCPMQIKLLLLASVLAFSMIQNPVVSIRRVPPETFPPCSGIQPIYGTLGIMKKDGEQFTNLTPEEVGDYVVRRLKQGYKVTLYPQISGKIFAIAECPTDGQD
jgi:hypothetical protein